MRKVHTRRCLALGAIAVSCGFFLGTKTAEAASYYVCDCDTDADPDCLPGSDGSDGTTPGTAWQSYDKARQEFAALAPQDSILFCRGGALEATGGSRWVNASCLAGQPCEVGAYAPDWGSGDEGRPIIWVRSDQHGFALEDGGDAEHEEGYVFRGLELRCTVCETTGANGFFLYNDIDDVTLEDLVIDGFGIGVHLAGSNQCSSDPECDGLNERLTLRDSIIINSHAQGFLGAGNGTVIENNTFEANGTRAVYDHNIYYSGAASATSGTRITGNSLYRSAWAPTGSCTAVSLVVHGQHSDLLIENNIVREDIGAAEPGCWGIAVDPGYSDESEGFTGVVIRGNEVVNVGNMAIGVASCVDCVIENNIVVSEQEFGVVGIAAPDRDRGDEDTPEDSVVVRNNSIYMDTSSGTGIRVGGEGGNHVVVSNAILYPGTGSFDCLDLDLAPAAYDAVGHNVCWFPGTTSGEWNNGAGGDPDPLTAWQQASGLGDGSQNADPGFAAPSAPSYDLSAASDSASMVDTGHPTLSATSAFGGLARDQQPDVGAFEYGSTQPAPDAGTADSATSSDGSVSDQDGSSSSKKGDSGCGCLSVGRADAASRQVAFWALLVIMGLFWLRRRRQKSAGSQ